MNDNDDDRKTFSDVYLCKFLFVVIFFALSFTSPRYTSVNQYRSRAREKEEGEKDDELPNPIDSKMEHVQDVITSTCGKEKKTQND